MRRKIGFAGNWRILDTIMWKVFALLKLLRKDLIVMLLALRHSDTPRRVKGMFLAGLIYLLSPIDLVPDMIPFAGIVDDTVVVPGLVYGLMQLLPYHVRQESEARALHVTKHLPIILGVATLFIVAWLGLIVWGIYSLIRYLIG